MVLGSWSSKDTLYGGEGYSVASNGDLAEQLKDAILRLPQFEPPAPSAAIPKAPEPIFTPAARRPAISTKAVFSSPHNRVIHQLQDARGVPVVYGGRTLTSYGTLVAKRLAALIGLRDRAAARAAIAKRRLARGEP